MFKNHTTLYKVSAATKRMQVWEAWVVGAVVTCQHGELGGAQTKHSYVAEPKNLGRSNETTAEEQAVVELQAMYKSQIDNRHYRTSAHDAHEFADSCKEPRKITNYKDRFSKMSPDLITSVKKNGSRACVLDGTLYSKIGRAEDIKVAHLTEAVEKLQEAGLGTFDAEVYAHGLSLQRIRSAWLKPVKTEKEILKIARDRKINLTAAKTGETLKAKDTGIDSLNDAVEYLGYNPNEDAAKLQFHVFDIPNTTGKVFEKRLTEDMNTLVDFVAENGMKDVIQFCEVMYTTSHEERMELLDKYVELGYEGLVHYETQGIYEFGKRSTNAAKSKPRYDSEAKVLDVTKDKSGQGVLHVQACDALEGAKFKCKMKGTAEERAFEMQKELIGQWITFSYEELSDKGVPTKPVGENMRLCDEDGSPLE